MVGVLLLFACLWPENIDGCCRATPLHCSGLMLYISRIFVPFLSNPSLPLILLHFNFFLTFGRPRWPSLSLQIIHNPIKASCQPMRCRTAYRLTTAAINITDANRGFPIASVLILRYLWYKSGLFNYCLGQSCLFTLSCAIWWFSAYRRSSYYSISVLMYSTVRLCVSHWCHREDRWQSLLKHGY